jgi:hypothetical protein
MSDETNNEVNNEEAVQQDQQAQPEAIGLQDLQVLAQIVDLASSRGAFRGAELSQVGAVYDKLSTFLSYVAETQKAQQDAEEESASESPEEK